MIHIIGLCLVYGIFIFPFVVVVSLIFRPYILWYLKINKHLRAQEETNRLQAETNRLLNEQLQRSTSTSRSDEGDYRRYMPRS